MEPSRLTPASHRVRQRRRHRRSHRHSPRQQEPADESNDTSAPADCPRLGRGRRVGLPPRLFAQAVDEAFKQGMQARDDDKWADVVTQMRRAVMRDGTDATRKVQLPPRNWKQKLNVFNRPEVEYLPHFFIGEALFRQNECLGAINEWVISMEQGAVKSRTDFTRTIDEGYRQCDAKGILSPNEFNAARDPARQAIEQAEGLAQKVSDLAQANRDVVGTGIADSIEGPRKEIAAAKSRLASAERNRTRSDFAEAKIGADRARTALVAIGNGVEAALVRNASITQQAAEVDKIIAGARETDRAIDDTQFALSRSRVRPAKPRASSSRTPEDG